MLYLKEFVPLFKDRVLLSVPSSMQKSRCRVSDHCAGCTTLKVVSEFGMQLCDFHR